MLCLRLLLPLGLSLAAMLVANCALNAADKADADGRARAFLKDHEARFKPLEVAGSRAWWNANVSGKDEDFAKKAEAQNRIDAALADKAKFQELKQIKEAGGIADPVLARAAHTQKAGYLDPVTVEGEWNLFAVEG